MPKEMNLINALFSLVSFKVNHMFLAKILILGLFTRLTAAVPKKQKAFPPTSLAHSFEP